MAKLEPVKMTMDACEIVEQLGRFAEAARIMAEAFDKAAAVVSGEASEPEPSTDAKHVSKDGHSVQLVAGNTAVKLDDRMTIVIPPGTPGKIRSMSIYRAGGVFYMREARFGALVHERKVCQFQVLGSRALPASLVLADE